MDTLGVIVGNRGFFPDHLCELGRKEILKTLEKLNISPVILPVAATKFGSVESLADAEKCAELFRQNAGKICGILVTLPNFGDERGVAYAVRWSGLKVPILVHAFSDDPARMTIKDRRDSFCGKMSVCNNLRQCGLRYTLTARHTIGPDSGEFYEDLARFLVTCRVVRGLKNLRIGALGARPAAFNTVRYSEKLLERSGISVETMDLYELFGQVGALKDHDDSVQAKLEEIVGYVESRDVPKTALLKMAKLGVAIDQWMRQNRLQATTIQCWTAVEEYFGIVPCTLMSMMSNMMKPSACEVDVMGAVAMHAMAQGSGRPSAIVDWNNNYGDDADKAVLFHCSNLPKDVFKEEGKLKPRMDYQAIIAGTVGKENAFGTVVGRMKAMDFTYLRLSSDDTGGRICAYVGEGKFVDDPLDTFGGYGIAQIPNFQKLLAFICENGFEHHVAINLSRIAGGVREALEKYLGWEVYHHT
jgi:L-fucose isomerase-like protein